MNPNPVTDYKPPNLGMYYNSEVQYVFVYGTLKRGGALNKNMEFCSYVDDDRLKGFLFSGPYYPTYVPGHKAGDVHGEVWKIDPYKAFTVMQRLDAVEGVPTLYYRLPFRTAKNYVCWVYWKPLDRIDTSLVQVLPTGKWVPEGNHTVPWSRYMSENMDYQWPVKPRVKYVEIAKAYTVCLFDNDYGVCGDYKEAATHFSGHSQNVPTKTIPPSKPAVPLYELAWLDNSEKIENLEKYEEALI